MNPECIIFSMDIELTNTAKKMKHILVVLLSLSFLKSNAQVCEPNGVATNPSTASNQSAPNVHYINSFSWFQHAANNVLLDIPLSNMNDYYNIGSMLNPYNESNGLCYYLADADLSQLDVYPEDGWELLFFNLGNYPDEAFYTSQNSNIPYIILYNKFRSIIRLFANAKFVEPNFDEISVALKFNEDFEYSGLFRYNDVLDRTLDQTTIVPVVSSYAILPSNHNEWFHVDFQVAYDPCTCLYDSRLQLVFTPIESTQIALSNEDFEEVNIDLMTTDGLDQESTIIPVAPRMITFHTMTENVEYARVVAEKYLERMANDGFYSDWLNWVYSPLALLEALAHAESNVISAAEIDAAAQHAVDMRNQWGFSSSGVSADFLNDVETTWGILPASSWSYNPDNYHYTVDLEEIVSFCQQHMPVAQSFSSSAIKVGENENKFSITPSSSYSSLNINLQTAPPGNTETVNLLNPGTYPIQENDVTFEGVDAQNYPVYNEVLGLFAVLQAPKFDIYHKMEIIEGEPWVNTYCDNTCYCTNFQNAELPGPFTTERITYSENHNTYRFRLSEPLKIVYNPVIGLNDAEVKVKASLTLRGNTQDIAPEGSEVYSYDGSGPADVNSFNCYIIPAADFTNRYIKVDPYNYMFHYSTHVNNLAESELLYESSSAFSYSSKYVDLDYFNTEVFELTTSTTQQWRDYPRNWVHNWENGNPNEVTCWWESPQLGFCGEYPSEIFDAIIDEKQLNTLRQVNFNSPSSSDPYQLSIGFIDLLFEIKVNSNGNEVVYQHVRYPLIEEEQNQVNSEFQIPWSSTQNPNPIGSYDMQQIAYYGQKNWQLADMNTIGGEYLNPPSSSPAIMPSAITFIEILGNQSKSNDVTEVVFKSENSIIVHGDVIIPSGFTLKLEDLVQETSSPTPIVSVAELSAFCEGLGGNTYHANARSSNALTSNHFVKKNPQQASPSLQIYPSPARNLLTIRTVGISELQALDVLNPLGTLVMSISAYKFTSPNNVSIDTSQLESGTYYLKCTYASGETQLKTFVVIH